MLQTMNDRARAQDLTVAETFWQDPEVQRALRMLEERLTYHQSQIQGPRTAIPSRTEAYREMIEDFSALRGGQLFFPYLGSGIGHGALVELADGSVKYDFINGIGAHHFGHSHPKLCSAAVRGALGDTVMQGNLQQNTVSHTFVKKLLEPAPFAFASSRTGEREWRRFRLCFPHHHGGDGGGERSQDCHAKEVSRPAGLGFRTLFCGPHHGVLPD